MSKTVRIIVKNIYKVIKQRELIDSKDLIILIFDIFQTIYFYLYFLKYMLFIPQIVKSYF